MVMPIKNKLVIIDGASNDVVEREMTKEELQELNSQQIDPNEQINQAKVKTQAKATAEGKLAALGLTTDDLRALGL
jgi:hypothetical protein